jgi:hypothetical protein
MHNYISNILSSLFYKIKTKYVYTEYTFLLNLLPLDISNIYLSYLTETDIFYIKGEWIKIGEIKWPKEQICSIAINNGWIDLLEYAIENGHKIEDSTYHNIIHSGSLEILEWFNKNCHNKKHIWSKNIYNCAAMKGDIEILKWIKQNCPESKHNDWTYELAVKNGHFEAIKWFREDGAKIKFRELLCLEVEENDKFEILDWLKDNGCSCKGRYHIIRN